jgi:hypothetical protein
MKIESKSTPSAAPTPRILRTTILDVSKAPIEMANMAAAATTTRPASATSMRIACSSLEGSSVHCAASADPDALGVQLTSCPCGRRCAADHHLSNAWRRIVVLE